MFFSSVYTQLQSIVKCKYHWNTLLVFRWYKQASCSDVSVAVGSFRMQVRLLVIHPYSEQRLGCFKVEQSGVVCSDSRPHICVCGQEHTAVGQSLAMSH